MDHSKRLFTTGEVDDEIRRGFRWLRFSKAFERKFEAACADDRCRHLILHNYIGLLIYHCFLFSDYLAVRDVFKIDLFMHFVVMTPVMFLVNYLLSRRPLPWLREGIVSLALVLLSLTIVAVVASSRSPDAEILHLSTVLVVLFAIVMQRIRFWCVLPTCLLIQLTYTIGLSLFVPVSADRAIMWNSVVFGITVFSLIGAYNLEYEQRMGYLLRLRERLRNRELEITSLEDSLTGLGNRRAMDAALHLRETDAKGSTSTTAILLLDIDHFKRFNDENGHQAGDSCLQRIAGLIAKSLGEQADNAYRFGGEEFLVILDDTTLGHALAVAERIRTDIAGARIPRGAGAVEKGQGDTGLADVVTVSIGVTAGCLGEGATPARLIAAADAALYSAKAKGRDRVCISIDDGGEQPSGRAAMKIAG